MQRSWLLFAGLLLLLLKNKNWSISTLVFPLVQLLTRRHIKKMVELLYLNLLEKHCILLKAMEGLRLILRFLKQGLLFLFPKQVTDKNKRKKICPAQLITSQRLLNHRNINLLVLGWVINFTTKLTTILVLVITTSRQILVVQVIRMNLLTEDRARIEETIIEASSTRTCWLFCGFSFDSQVHILEEEMILSWF